MRATLRLLLTAVCVASLPGDALGFFSWRSHSTIRPHNVVSTNDSSKSTYVTEKSTNVTTESTHVTDESTNINVESTSTTADLTEDTRAGTDSSVKLPNSSTVETLTTKSDDNHQQKNTEDALKKEHEDILLEMEKLLAQEQQWDMTYGRAIGYQMNDLQKEQLLIAQKIISDVIYNAKQGKLTNNSHVALNSSEEKNQELTTTSLPTHHTRSPHHFPWNKLFMHKCKH